MKHYLLTLLFIILVFPHLWAQTPTGEELVTIHTVTNSTAMNSIGGASSGALVFNLADKKMYVYDGTNWQAVGGNGPEIGRTKHSFQSADHGGWYLLNGRSLSSLSTSAASAANSIGISGNLPNASDRVLKHPKSGESVGDIGGEASTTLTQANLPNVNFTGTTSNNGNHNHDFSGYFSWESIRHSADAWREVLLSGGSNNTNTTGNHTHSVSINSGGSNQPIDQYQPYLVANTFIYLGV